MPSDQTSQSHRKNQHHSSNNYTPIRIINTMSKPQKTTNDAEVDMKAESWKLPYSIEDKDLQFNGKPLNLLYEENRWTAEHKGQRQGTERGIPQERKCQRGRTMQKSKH